jgi:hypothetical protein
MAKWFGIRTGLGIQAKQGQRAASRSGMPLNPHVQRHDVLNAKPARPTNAVTPAKQTA